MNITYSQLSEIRFRSWEVGYHQGLANDEALDARVALALNKSDAAWAHAINFVFHHEAQVKAQSALDAVMIAIEGDRP